MEIENCPYCNEKPKLVDSSVIYGKSYGFMYLCKPCDAYVNCHKGTTKPLGRLANVDLRYYKRIAHESFDPLWETAIKKGRTKKESRGAAYKWLSISMNIKPENTHIGMFNIEQCKKVIELCKPYN